MEESHKQPTKSSLEEVTMDRCKTNLSVREGEMSIEREQRGHFNVLTAIGMNYSIIGTPLSIGTFLSFVIGVGGSPVYIWGYLVTIVMQFFVCLSLAEISGSLPHPTGQVHWTSVLAPKKYARKLSYITASLTACAWLFWTTATWLLGANMVTALITVCDPTFEAHGWHVFLCILLMAFFSFLLNTIGFSLYPYMLKCATVLINGGALLVLVVLLVRTPSKQSPRTVFIDIVNETGWDSNVWVFLLGLLPGISTINGFDAATHVAHELPNPSVQIPQIMVGTAVIAGLSGVPMTIVYMFCVTSEANLLDPIDGQPIISLLSDSLNSFGLTVTCIIILLMVFFIGSAAIVTTTSRVFWSLAEQSLFPDRRLISKIRGRHALPLNAIILTTAAGSAIGLLELGATTALNAILGSAAVCFFASYSIAIGCLLTRSSGRFAEKPYLSLGCWGRTINIISIAWMSLMAVVLMFPLYLPVTAANMNYTAPVMVVIGLVFWLNWLFHAGKRYIEPVESTHVSAVHDA